MTTRDIQDNVKELYGVDVSPSLISEMTEDLDAELKAWQTRRIDAVFPTDCVLGWHRDSHSRRFGPR